VSFSVSFTVALETAEPVGNQAGVPNQKPFFGFPSPRPGAFASIGMCIAYSCDAGIEFDERKITMTAKSLTFRAVARRPNKVVRSGCPKCDRGGDGWQRAAVGPVATNRGIAAGLGAKSLERFREKAMDTLTSAELDRLIRHSGKPMATVFIPTHPDLHEDAQDQLRLRKNLDQAETLLAADGMPPKLARETVQRARRHVTQPSWWQARDQGLAIFLAEDFCQMYRFPDRFEERVLVGDRFHVKPLLSYLEDARKYYVLAFSQRRARLLQGSSKGLTEIDVPGMPERIDAVMEFDDVEHGVQLHSISQAGGSRRSATFHGHGGERDTSKSQLAVYCRDVCDALQPVLRDELAPLVVFAVGSVDAILREHLVYASLLPDCVEGNPDHWTGQELHAKSWQAVQPALDAPRRAALDKLRESLNTPRTSLQISEILRAAVAGKVDTLLVRHPGHCWGTFDPRTFGVQIQERESTRNDDLLDLAIHLALKSGGRAFLASAGELPVTAEVAALYRYN
jgi:hypothetical protein